MSYAVSAVQLAVVHAVILPFHAGRASTTAVSLHVHHEVQILLLDHLNRLHSAILNV